MGSADMEVIQNPEMAAVKPRERQFQVVPMPGVFTRGRWKCWDYYMDREDGQSEKKDQMLDFEKGKEKECDLVVQENFTADIVTATTTIAADGSASYITTQEAFSDDKMTPVKESSTFIVTSIAAAPQTPQHGTPQSSNDILERMKNSPMDVYTQITHQHDSAPSVVTQTIGTVLVDSGPTSTNPSSAALTQITTVQTTTSTQPSAAAPSNGSSSQTTAAAIEDDGASTTSTTTLTNGAPQQPLVAAIDNKIEQAMDLVKTHLTFAVREEVEVLRQTITDLENRVAALESENQLLRQYAPSDIVSTLPNIVSQLKANSAPQTSSVAPSLPPPKVPAGFCSTIFANTLNNVVAEVSREISGQTHQ